MSLIAWSAKPKIDALKLTDTFMRRVPTGGANLNQEIPLSDVKDFLQGASIPSTWGVSDEDSPLTVGVLYTTEAADTTQDISGVILSLKNAPTGSNISVDIAKETGVNTNVFATIFSTLPTIDIAEFTSQTAATPPVISDTTWETQRRLQLILNTNDSNLIASGLKVTLT